VLEHLATPGVLLERVYEWLRDDGQVIVSVPHGYHPYHDHKRSFYLGSLLELLNQKFTILHAGMVAQRFLCAVAIRPAGGRPPELPSFAQLRAWERPCLEVLEQADAPAVHGTAGTPGGTERGQRENRRSGAKRRRSICGPRTKRGRS